MQPCLTQGEPIGFHGHRFFAGQKPRDGIERFIHAPALMRGINAHHESIRYQRARPAAQHHAPARHVIQLHKALRDQQRVVIGQACDARTKLDVLGAFRRRRDHNLRARDGFPASGMMLPNPGLIKAQMVKPFDQFQIAREPKCRVVANPMKRGQENAEAKAARQHGWVLHHMEGGSPARNSSPP